MSAADGGRQLPLNWEKEAADRGRQLPLDWPLKNILAIAMLSNAVDRNTHNGKRIPWHKAWVLLTESRAVAVRPPGLNNKKNGYHYHMLYESRGADELDERDIATTYGRGPVPVWRVRARLQGTT
jgi:hypothetical protein